LQEKLEIFANTLLKWNEKINLIGRSTAADVRSRHIADSLQVVDPVRAELNSLSQGEKVIVDFGSGAGLPGIIMAIALEDVFGVHIYLCESNAKKCAFLNNVISELNLKNVSVKNSRIEDVKDIKADIITARAFAEMKLIFELSENFRKNETKFILHKGENLDKELIEANKYFSYKYETYPSETGSGVIIQVSDLARN
jgi:16S rRNA (guanine527-N7)-methyltransferase